MMTGTEEFLWACIIMLGWWCWANQCRIKALEAANEPERPEDEVQA